MSTIYVITFKRNAVGQAQLVPRRRPEHAVDVGLKPMSVGVAFQQRQAITFVRISEHRITGHTRYMSRTAALKRNATATLSFGALTQRVGADNIARPGPLTVRMCYVTSTETATKIYLHSVNQRREIK